MTFHELFLAFFRRVTATVAFLLDRMDPKGINTRRATVVLPLVAVFAGSTFLSASPATVVDDTSRGCDDHHVYDAGNKASDECGTSATWVPNLVGTTSGPASTTGVVPLLLAPADGTLPCADASATGRAPLLHPCLRAAEVAQWACERFGYGSRSC